MESIDELVLVSSAQLRSAMIRVDNQGIPIVWHGVLEVVISLNLPRSSVNVTWRAKNQRGDSCCGGSWMSQEVRINGW